MISQGREGGREYPALMDSTPVATGTCPFAPQSDPKFYYGSHLCFAVLLKFVQMWSLVGESPRVSMCPITDPTVKV